MSHHRFQLPRADGTWLIDPPIETWPSLTASNHKGGTSSSLDCQGRDFAELRRQTQRHAGQLAAAYTSELLGQPVPAVDAVQWIVTGHQPELFHPGVWVKNFAVHALAGKTGAAGLNLIIDQDTHTGTSIAVPAGSPLSPLLQSIEFDEPRPTCPWEELPLANSELFNSFAARIASAMVPWGISPLVTNAWSIAQGYLRRVRKPRLCDCLTAMRAAVERRWQAGNLELPMSRLTETPGFYWFTAHILAQLPRFLPLYNSIVDNYRRQHRLRSRTHPVPNLAIEGDWREAPFWVWRARDVQRDRLFARQVDHEVWLRDSRELLLKLPLTPNRSACCAVEQLATLPSRGIRLRSRALTTTLFVRLFLADLFVHGIGGAKYDEMTDALIEKFYGLTAPGYATISATVHLPLGGGFEVSRRDLGESAHQLWDVEHSPERFIPQPTPPAHALIAEKWRLIAEHEAQKSAQTPLHSFADREENRRRHLRLRDINLQLQSEVAAARQKIHTHRDELYSQAKANRILRSREFAWLLFPEQQLEAFVIAVP